MGLYKVVLPHSQAGLLAVMGGLGTRIPLISLVPRPSTPRPFGKLEREAWCGGSGDETNL